MGNLFLGTRFLNPCELISGVCRIEIL